MRIGRQRVEEQSTAYHVKMRGKWIEIERADGENQAVKHEANSSSTTIHRRKWYQVQSEEYEVIDMWYIFWIELLVA
jgi:hypothetical protein